MNEPVRIDRYISLIVEEELDKDQIKSWFSLVCGKSPFGVITALQGNNDGNPETIRLVHRHTKKGHYYMIPISRDLLEYEAQRIVVAWTDENPEIDFDIEVTVIPTNPFEKKEPTLTVDQKKMIDLATSLAKKEHEDWVTARTNEGWRYGQTLSIEDKTHPLLRPWSDLPDKHKTIDIDKPQKIIDLLKDQGYSVVSNNDLDVVRNLLRKL